MGKHLYAVSTSEIKEIECPCCKQKVEGLKFSEGRAYKRCLNCHNEVVVILIEKKEKP